MLELLPGFRIMFAGLAAAGLTRGRWLPQRAWVVVWFFTSAALVLVMAAAPSSRADSANWRTGSRSGTLSASPCIRAITS